MSRLIDADELKRAFIGNRYGTKAIEYVIDDAPTVEAIPIEWLKLKIDTVLNIYPNGNDETEVLCKLLYDWEKENEINRCRQNETRG